jgi:chitodextrinase
MIKKITTKVILFGVILALVFPSGALGAMRSASYVIYENIHHTFDGPVISGVSASVSGQSATVTWTTDVTADGFVVYDTDPAFSAPKEQGSSEKNGTSLSVNVTGLAANTTYYYRVRSERINGGITTDMTPRNFTSGSDAVPAPPAPEPAGGGGVLIIDKTDKAAPEITNVQISEITIESVTVSWETNEPSTSFVEYGIDANYGSTYGEWASTTAHRVTVPGLTSNREYRFRTLSSDGWGNVGYSDDSTFITAPAPGEEPIEPGEEPPEPEEPDEASLIAEATARFYEFISRLFPEVSLNNLQPEDLSRVGSLTELSALIAAPVLSGQPLVEVGATEATVSWTTDIEANSLVAIAPTDRYSPEAAESYLEVVGAAEELVRSHSVTVYGLTPDTEYHYQLRSKANIGPTARSRDFTFRTTLEALKITSFYPQIVDDQTAIFKWVTNKEADSAVTFAPYRGNVLAVDESKTVRDTATSTIHEVKITEFTGGTFYEIELMSMDAEGNIARETLSRFSTAEDDLPPEVTHIKADSTVFLDRGDKIQTIISWLTSEPATSRVFFQEGVHSSDTVLSESTALNTNYVKEHVMVIPKFKPGIVYSFRVESTDSGGNTTMSQVHTFMTAKKKESIIQIILRILEETFGWVKKIG